MLGLRKVAVTGGLACGKSSVCRVFRELGAYVVSADDIVHQLLFPNTPIGQQVIHLLGSDIVVDGKIDRKLIAKKVFNDKRLLQALENLLHPAVLDEIEKQYEEVKQNTNTTLFVAEVPLLFEINAENHFDSVIAVNADTISCQRRFHAATGLDVEEYNKRMAFQLPKEEKNKRANYIIYNNDSVQEMRTAVVNLFHQL